MTKAVFSEARNRHTLFSRGTRMAVAAASIVLVGATTACAPGRDDSSGRDRIPPDAWVVAQDAAGGLSIVSGRAAIGLVAKAAKRGSGMRVLSVQSDQPVHALEVAGTENDPLRPQQWALNRLSFESTWALTNGHGVTVAVIDSGVESDHQDLRGSVLPGKDYVNPGDDGRVDPDGHGTLVAGIIAAHVNNALGIVGAAPGVQILPVRVLDAKGEGIASNVAKGIVWAVDHGARVLNLSLGGAKSPGVEQALEYANSKGAVVIAAAGNNGQAGNAPVYPAAYPQAIAVAAVNPNLTHPLFGNTGSYVDLSAPGVGIISSWGSSPSAYADGTGTSMATPYASAEAALMISEKPSLSAKRVKQIMESTATGPGSGPNGHDPVFGHGLINPGAALFVVQPHPAGFATEGRGYWIVSATGHVLSFGHAGFHGDLTGRHLSAPIVASAATPDGKGYWLVAADGGVFAFGDARYDGSMAGHHLSSPIVAMAATPTGRGYLLLGADGGIFTFGDARFYGSTGGRRLNAPVVDVSITPNGDGYWFVGADGGIFTFGDARFYGSTGNAQLAAPVASMTSASNGSGYWTVATDGGVFAFHVPFEGSMPAVRLRTDAPVASTVRMRALPSNLGYYLLGANGAVNSFGTAKFFGSAPGVAAVDLMLTP